MLDREQEVAKKLRNLSFGKFAEDRAADYYVSQGYIIRERNWRFNKIEIDLIVQRENEIIFVEVKARSGKDMNPVDTVTEPKRRRIVRGADIYLRNMKGEYEYRFDIFALEGDMKNYRIEVYENAFLSPLM